MKPPHKQRLSSLAVVLALAAVLIVLGALQYRWSREVSEASALRMQAALHSSVLSWRQDLYHELAQAGDAFQFIGAGDSQATIAEALQRYREASRTAAHPALVKAVFMFQAADPNARLLRLNQAGDAFGPVSWPEDFEQLHQWLLRTSHDAVFYVRFPRHAGQPEGPPGLFPQEHGRMLVRRGPALIAQDVPALVYPVMFHGKSRVAGRKPRALQVDWFIVQLDSVYLREHLFPELADRYFGGSGRLTYRVAVISAGRDRAVLYSSDADFDAQKGAAAELTATVFGPPFGMVSSHPGGLHGPPPPPKEHPLQARTGDEPEWPDGRNVRPPDERNSRPAVGGEGGMGIASSGAVQFSEQLYREHFPPAAAGMSPFLRFVPVHYDGPPSDWQLVVRSRGGSLEAVAAAIRRRNLAISFGVLLVLAATVGMILIASQRAQRLAKLQMEFVAAVSHELRTPLTVISSAAENIVDGVVENKQQIMQYGKVIKGQARQLILLVEQVLLFAATKDGGYRYHLQLLRVEDIVNAALESTAGLVSAAGVRVETEIPPELPQVEGDLSALSQCLQNLITNAVKYGGEQRWIAVRALRQLAEGGDEILISVADRGPGIERGELEQIFQPFYRSPSAMAAQIHGTGLGLPLAKSIAEAMSGRLTVSSEPGSGSTFVLHLPVAAAGAVTAPQVAAAGAKVS